MCQEYGWTLNNTLAPRDRCFIAYASCEHCICHRCISRFASYSKSNLMLGKQLKCPYFTSCQGIISKSVWENFLPIQENSFFDSNVARK